MANLVEIAAQLVSSRASNNPMTSDELLAEIGKVHTALKNLAAGHPAEGGKEVKPSITVKEAFKKNEIVCMICEKGGFKTLARHLSTAHAMKPGTYRKQFGIPSGQPLSAKSYSEARRQMAQERGLADNLAKARQVRMANIEARMAPAKPATPVKAVKESKVAASTALVATAEILAETKNRAPRQAAPGAAKARANAPAAASAKVPAKGKPGPKPKK